MQPLQALDRYFLTGTAEEDRPFLERAFITHEQLTSVLSIEPGAVRILAGSKGIGKTALFEWLAKVATKHKLPVLLLRPDDLDTRAVPAVKDIATLKRAFYETLVSAIAVSLGRQLKGFLKGADAKLYQEAISSGARDPDFFGKIFRLLSSLAVPVTHVDGVQLAKDLAGKQSPDAAIRTITQHLLAKGALLFLLIDDTDQVSAPWDASQLNRIWALLLAVRRLAGECPELRCVVSLRTEIWARSRAKSAICSGSPQSSESPLAENVAALST